MMITLLLSNPHRYIKGSCGTLALLLFPFCAWSQLQTGEHGPVQRNCATTEVLQQQLKTEPQRAQALKAIEAHTARFLKAQISQSTTNTLITIPVVVHLVYNSSMPSISDAQVKSQIAVLNKDFRRLNTDADNTWSQAADVEIEFKLATVNPMGTSSTGITRTNTSVTSFTTDDAVKFGNRGGKNAWPAKDYLNLWVCNLSGKTLGYAQYPGGSATTDGVVIDYQYFGTTGTAIAPFNLGRTTTHEVGHWLNLNHIWGDGDCTVDDGVSDTPKAAAPNYGCNIGNISCSSTDMVQNYMDYSDDACMNLFTAGQKARMRALFSSGGARVSLLSSKGLGGSGTPEPTTCTTNEVSLKLVLDEYANETSWELKSSTGSIVASGGPYSTGNATINENFCLPDGCYDFVIKDAFGDGICCTYGNGSYSLMNDNGQVLASSSGNYGAGETKNICVGGSTDRSCASLNFNDYTLTSYADQGGDGSYQVQDGGSTLFLNGNTWKQIPFNYTITANTVLEFEYRSTKQGEIQGIAFENNNSISPEVSFRVYGNQTWGIDNYDNYSGTSWKKYSIPVGDYFTGSFTKLVFMGDDDTYGLQTSYFRNVKVYEGTCGTTRVADLRTGEAPRLGTEGEASINLSLYPNPAQSELTLSLSGEKSATAMLYNLAGRQLWQGQLQEGQPLKLAVDHLPAGIYTLRSIGQSGASQHMKFIKQ